MVSRGALPARSCFSSVSACGWRIATSIAWRPISHSACADRRRCGRHHHRDLFATPEAFIFFGILHSIALASVLGLAFLRRPGGRPQRPGIFVLVSRPFLQTPLLDGPSWWWTGLSAIIPVSNDYVPVFPFFGMVLLGIAAAQLAGSQGWLIYPGDAASSTSRSRACCASSAGTASSTTCSTSR